MPTFSETVSLGAPRSEAWPLQVKVLGDFSASYDDRPLPIATRKAKAVVAYLAMSENGRGARERLVGLLWSESGEERARASLRQAVRDIKLACDHIGFDGLILGKQALALHPGRLDCDVGQILGAVARGSVHPRLLETPRLADSLLEGMEDLDPSYQVWVRAKRQSLQDRLVSGLEKMLSAERSADDASDPAAALLLLDPTHEPACRHLIRARARRGDVGGAMRAYKALWDLLEADYDVEPSRDTQNLIVALRGSVDPEACDGPTSDAAVPNPAQQPRSGKPALWLSILAFDCAGVAPDQRYVVTGFRHELVACLARFREWTVRAWPHDDPMPAPSWSSPPEYLVEGSAYEAGSAVRLIITFRDRATGVCIWSDRLTLSLPGWSDTQQHIVRKIAAVLNVHLSAERLRRVAATGSVALEVHDRWLRGQSLVHHLASGDWGLAAEIFEGLVSDAPDFVPGLTSLVQLRNTEHIAKPGHFRDRRRDAEVLAQARRATYLDPLDARAQLNLAWTHQLAARVDQSTLHAALAVEMNGNDPWTLMSAGQIFAYCGEYDRAEELAAISIDTAPAAAPQQMAYLSAIRFLSGDYAGAVEAATEGLAKSPGFRVWRCAALAHLGRRSEAHEELNRAFADIARDWHGDHRPTPAAMSLWMLHAFPIAIGADWSRLHRGLEIAGAPVAAVGFGAW